jgi:outer membrane protein TolC
MTSPLSLLTRSLAAAVKKTCLYSCMLAVPAALMVTSGCTLAPDYERPDVEIPTEFRYEPRVVSETANTTWWTQFGDPVLDELIATALVNNYDVKIAAANVEQALGIVTQTRSDLYPQIGYGASGEKRRLGNTELSGNVPLRQLGTGFVGTHKKSV